MSKWFKRLIFEVRLRLWIRRVRRAAKTEGSELSQREIIWAALNPDAPYLEYSVTTGTLVENPPVNDRELLELIREEGNNEKLYLATVTRQMHQSTCQKCREQCPTT